MMPSPKFEAEDAEMLLNSLFLELQDIGLITWDGEGRINSLSESCRRLMQLPLSIKVGEPISILWQLTSLAFMQAFESASEQPQYVSLEKELQLSRDGERYWLHLKVRPCPASHGKPPTYFLLVRDITHKRRAMQFAKRPCDLFDKAFRLMPGAAILESIFHQLSFALGVIDTNRHFVQMSNAALALFGYTRKEIVGHPLRMIYGSGEAFEQTGRQLHVNKPLSPIIADLKTKSGRVFKGRLRHSPFYDATQQFKGYLIAFEDVTEQLEHIESLRRYERMVSASSDALLFIDRNLVYQAVNEAYLKLWRKQRHEVIGRPIAEIVDKSIYERVIMPALARCVTGETVNYPVAQITYPSGTFYMEVTYNPYRDENGAISGVLITLHDVTLRHLAEQAVLESEQRFLWAGEFAKFAVWELDVESRKLIEGEMLPRLLGYKEEDRFDVIDDWLSLVAEPDHQMMKASFERMLESPQGIVRIECRARRKDGEPVYIETLVDEVEKEGQRRLIGISRDMSREISRLAEEKEGLRQYERMTQTTADGLALVDRRHVYLAVNYLYPIAYGLPREAIIGKSVCQLMGDGPYHETVKQMLDAALAGKEVHNEGWFDYPRKGRRRMAFCYTPCRDDRQEVTSLLMTSHDVTERYLAEQALQESEEKFRAIFEHAPIGIGIVDEQEGQVLDINAAGVQMLGYPREEVMRLHPWEILEGLTREEFLASIQRIHRKGRFSFESTHRKKDGTPLQVLVHANSMTLQRRSVQLMMVVEITRQKQLEAQLREWEEQYRSLVQSTSAILFSADPETFQFTFVSQEAESLLGYPLQQWTEERDFWVSHIHPNDQTWAPGFCLESTRNQQDHSFDYRMIAADERIVWLHTVIRVVMEGESVASLVGVMVDISERKRAEEDRRRLSEIVKQSANAILLTDTDFHITYINEAFYQLYGYTQEELRGKKPDFFNAEENAQEIQSQIEGALQLDERVYREMLSRHKDGSLFTCQQIISPLRNEAGEVIAYMSSQGDISQRVEAERALRKSEERYRQIVETAQEGIWVTDAQDRTTFVNPSMARMLGYHEAEMRGRSLFDFMDEAVRKQSEQRLEEQRQGRSVTRDFRFRHKAGRDIWTRVSANPLYDEAGVYIGTMIMIDDISETRNLQDALISVQKMEAVGQLTGGIAHDFNNILGSILGFTELARDRFGGYHDKLREYLQQIETAGGRARDLIRQLMIFSRGENTQAATSIPLAPLVREVVRMLSPMLPAMVEIRTELPQVSPHVIVDPLHIQQILMNLCINARDAIDGAGVITITLALRRTEHERCSICSRALRGEWVSLLVSDTGRGIPRDLQGEIFQPFVTSKGVGEGSGMGLAVVRGILRSYEAHLKVASIPGQGASFEILFNPSQTSGGETGETQGAGAATFSLKGRRILVVDDEPQIQAYFDALFSELGAEVICCSSGAQALDTLMRTGSKFDLVVTDEAMPGMKGSELVRQLRMMGCSVPVILCSGYYDRQTEAQAQAQKIVAQLQKPVKKAELLAVIESLFSAQLTNPEEPGK